MKVNYKSTFIKKMKFFLLSSILIFCIVSPLLGQSDKEKNFSFRTALVVNAFTYNLNKKNSFGLHFGQIPPTTVNVNNVENLEKNFFGFNYAYAFECINCDSFFVMNILNNSSSIVTTVDGSTYTYSGWGFGVFGGYNWYFENDFSVILSAGPLYASESKENENIKSDNDFGKDADERMEKLSLLPLFPLLLVSYSF